MAVELRALSGLRARIEQLDRLAADIANAGTAGYKASGDLGHRRALRLPPRAAARWTWRRPAGWTAERTVAPTGATSTSRSKAAVLRVETPRPALHAQRNFEVRATARSSRATACRAR